MKLNIGKNIFALSLGVAALCAQAGEGKNMHQYHNIKEATIIHLNAKLGKTMALSSLLSSAASIVKTTEPNTKAWFALEDDKNTFYIFDVFLNEQGRAEHFDGQVANALKQQSGKLVLGGWDNGVVKHIQNAKVLSAKMPQASVNMTVANYIPFEAKQGKEQQLADLLSQAAAIVAKTEPKTNAWFAIQLSKSKFAIFDAFESVKGQTAHFQGKVASLLKSKASVLIKGGWNDGVVKNIYSLKIISHK